ncbi:agmatinase [bacterium]|nr:agmatinase [bacterium]
MDYLDAGRNFLGIENCHTWNEASFAILPVPLEKTTSYLHGTGGGPAAILEASRQVEMYDDECLCETYRKGIVTLLPMTFEKDSHQRAVDKITTQTKKILKHKKKPVLIGGEHSLSIGAVRAMTEKYPDLHVLHLDAHADLREEYENSDLNHACVMSQIRNLCSFTSVGIRSLSKEESDTIHNGLLDVWTVHKLRRQDDWIQEVMKHLHDPLYISLDLDVFDPSVIPNVGTPEPGGLFWDECLRFLKAVFGRHQVAGMDMVELSPESGPAYGVFSAAKLLYRLIGYWGRQE